MQQEGRQFNTVGRAVQAYRLGLGWTLRDLSRELGVSSAYLADVERGAWALPRTEAARWERVCGMDGCWVTLGGVV